MEFETSVNYKAIAENIMLILRLLFGSERKKLYAV